MQNMGVLIQKRRKEKQLTQKQLAELLCVSDKTVSKWECAKGCPDVMIMPRLAEALDLEVGMLLGEQVRDNSKEGKSMKKVKFYVCEQCSNVLTSLTDAKITCCGHVLSELKASKAQECEALNVEDMGDEWFISSPHSMTKEHYVSFIAIVSGSKISLEKLYPEWNLQAHLPHYRYSRLYWYCTICGLKEQNIK